MKQQGFTLVELMIVVVIVAFLATIAIVDYIDYAISARVTEGLNMAATAKEAVAETTAVMQAFPTNQTQTSWLSPKATKNVSSIVIGANGRITITYTKTAGSGTIILIPKRMPDGTLTWTCTRGTLAKKYRPANCR